LLSRGEASLARRGPLGVMILFAGAVREKLRTWSWRESLEAAPNCLMPDEYMVEGRFGGIVGGRRRVVQRQQRDTTTPTRVYDAAREV
jgi:hypothetical protein